MPSLPLFSSFSSSSTFASVDGAFAFFKYCNKKRTDATPRAPTATPVTIVGVTSIGFSLAAAAVALNGKGEEDGYGIIMKKGDVVAVAVADPFSGHGVIINSGVEVGV